MATQGGTVLFGPRRDERDDKASAAPPAPMIPLWPWRTSALAAAQITLVIAGGWLMAAGVSYVYAARLRTA